MIGNLTWPETGLDGYKRGFATIDGTRLHYVSGGREGGDTLVLFPGFPQTWYAWRKILPVLGKRYRVIAPDLPGQGDSDRPLSGFDTANIAKIVRALLERLGADSHFLVAHDVGAWVAYPYVSMYRSSVKALAILDTGVPGISLPDNLPWASHVAWRTWHVAFHNLADLPELLIEGREDLYLNWFLQRKAANPQIFTTADIAEYQRTFKQNGLKGGLAYYRGITTSAEQNRQFAAKSKLEMPVLAVRADRVRCLILLRNCS